MLSNGTKGTEGARGTKRPCVLRWWPFLPLPFSRESKYEIRVLRVVACVRKFLYTVTQKMRLHKLKLAKMTKKIAKIRRGAANGRTAFALKKIAKIDDFRSVLREKMIFNKNFTNRYFFNVVLGKKWKFYVPFFPVYQHSDHHVRRYRAVRFSGFGSPCFFCMWPCVRKKKGDENVSTD